MLCVSVCQFSRWWEALLCVCFWLSMIQLFLSFRCYYRQGQYYRIWVTSSRYNTGLHLRWSAAVTHPSIVFYNAPAGRAEPFCRSFFFSNLVTWSMDAAVLPNAGVRFVFFVCTLLVSLDILFASRRLLFPLGLSGFVFVFRSGFVSPFYSHNEPVPPSSQALEIRLVQPWFCFSCMTRSTSWGGPAVSWYHQATYDLLGD